MAFLQKGFVLLLVVGILPIARARSQGTLDKEVYGVGILGNCCTHGAGACSAFQARKEFRVVGAFESDPRRAAELAHSLGGDLSLSYDDVINHPDVDIVVITCDPTEKPALVEKSAAAGKHIFLNKPPCGSLEGARRIAKAIKKHNVWLVHDIPMVRSVPVLARLLSDVQSHKHGRVIGYHHHFGMNFDPAFDLKAAWPERLDPASKSGGGEMTNIGCYAIDYVVDLLGSPKSVTAKWRKDWDVYRDADVENFGQVILDYGDFFALLDVGKQQQLGPHSAVANRVSIIFEHKTLMIDASAQLATVNHQPIGWEEYARGAAAVNSIDQLLLALRRGTPPSSGVDNIVPTTEVLMAAYRSILLKRPIPLPLEEDGNPLVELRDSKDASRGSSAVLAPDYRLVARSPDPEKMFLGSPAIVKLPTGRYVVTYDLFDNDPRGCVVLTSDDGCRTWQTRATVDLMWASPLLFEGKLYLLGSKMPAREVAIVRSDDNGETWSKPVTLFKGSYTGACVSVLFHNRHVYRAFEGQSQPPDDISSGWTSIVVAGDLDGDLLDPASWRISNAVSYPGTPESLTQGLHVRDARIKKGREGWLEGNIVEKDGRLFILLRTRMQAQTTVNMTSVCEVTDDGQQLTNRFLQFYPMPGGQNKFHILRDPQTGIYWTATTQVSDSFQDVEPLLKMGFKGTGGNERRIQVLMYSADALHWFQAGFVAFTPKLLECFSYSWLMIDGDDLIVLCRTSLGGLNNHDSNRITLHRIERFRELVPKGLFQPIPRVSWNAE